MPSKRVELTRAPIWEYQPREPKNEYNAFVIYRDQGDSRSRARVAAETGRPIQTIWDYSRKGQWDTRIHAMREHDSAIDRAETYAERREAARQDAAVLRAAQSAVVKQIHRLVSPSAAETLTVDQTIRLMDVTLKYRRMLYGDPLEAIPEGRPATPPAAESSPVQQVEVRHFLDMSPDGRVHALRDLIDKNVQWLAAAEDKDDD